MSIQNCRISRVHFVLLSLRVKNSEAGKRFGGMRVRGSVEYARLDGIGNGIQAEETMPRAIFGESVPL